MPALRPHKKPATTGKQARAADGKPRTTTKFRGAEEWDDAANVPATTNDDDWTVADLEGFRLKVARSIVNLSEESSALSAFVTFTAGKGKHDERDRATLQLGYIAERMLDQHALYLEIKRRIRAHA